MKNFMLKSRLFTRISGKYQTLYSSYRKILFDRFFDLRCSKDSIYVCTLSSKLLLDKWALFLSNVVQWVKETNSSEVWGRRFLYENNFNISRYFDRSLLIANIFYSLSRVIRTNKDIQKKSSSDKCNSLTQHFL